MSGTVWTVTVKKRGETAALSLSDGANLLEALQQAGMIGGFPCAGRGTCGKCRVRVTADAPEPTREELALLTREELASGLRLACRVHVHGAMSVALPDVEGGYAILTGGAAAEIAPAPFVRRAHLTLPATGADDCRSDLRRVADALGEPGLSAPLPALRGLADAMRAGASGFTAVYAPGLLLGAEPGNAAGRHFGVAVDIGTTTVACYLVDLATGLVAAVEGQANAQALHGADVISRVEYTLAHADGTETLRDRIAGQLTDMLGRLCAKAGISPRDIYHTTVAGNTIMLHLLLGLPTKNIAAAPFTPVTTALADLPAAELGLPVNGLATLLPGVASYVGADITAGLLACDVLDSDECTLLIDLGTNGEMAIGNRAGITACAVADGTALEGGNIRHSVCGV